MGRPRNLRRGTRSADPSPSRSPSPPPPHHPGHHPGQYQGQGQGQVQYQGQGQGQGQSQGQGQAQGQSQYQSQVQSQGPYSKNPHLPGQLRSAADLPPISEPSSRQMQSRLRSRSVHGGEIFTPRRGSTGMISSGQSPHGGLSSGQSASVAAGDVFTSDAFGWSDQRSPSTQSVQSTQSSGGVGRAGRGGSSSRPARHKRNHSWDSHNRGAGWQGGRVAGGQGDRVAGGQPPVAGRPGGDEDGGWFAPPPAWDPLNRNPFEPLGGEVSLGV